MLFSLLFLISERNLQNLKTSENYYNFYVFRQKYKVVNHTIKSMTISHLLIQPEYLLILAFLKVIVNV